jgi:hypothetical protein
MIGTVGVFMSTWLKRSGRAMIFSYLFILALAIAPTFIYGIVAILRQAEPPRWILVPSPISTLMSAISSSTTLGQSSIGMIGGLSILLSGNISGFSTTSIPRPLYHYSLPLYGLLTLVLYLFSTRLIRPARRWRLRWKEFILAAIIIFALIGLTALAFGITSNRYENISIFTAPTPFPAGPEPFMSQAIVSAPALALPDAEASSAYGNMIAAIADQGLLPESNSLFISRLIYLDPALPDTYPESAYPLSEEAQTKITTSLEDLPFEIVWLDDFFAYPPEGASGLEFDGGALILLGHLNPLKTGNLQVLASLYTVDQPAQHLTFELANQDAIWQVVETIIPQ